STPCRVRDARRQRGEVKGVKIRVALQLRDDSLKLAGRGVKNVVNLGIDGVERVLERLPLVLARRVFEEIQVSASGNSAGRDKSLNLLIGGRVTLCRADRRCDLVTIRVRDRDVLRGRRDVLGKAQADLGKRVGEAADSDTRVVALDNG